MGTAIGKALKLLQGVDNECGQNLLNNLLARIHHRHDSDKGDLFPRDYLSILRACFIIFGVFPKNWKPKTREDFDAIEKYHKRQLGYLLSRLDRLSS